MALPRVPRKYLIEPAVLPSFRVLVEICQFCYQRIIDISQIKVKVVSRGELFELV